MGIIEKLKKAKLVGRGGACFPTYLKWSFVKDAKGNPLINSGQVKKYVICNASEGEPGVKKDGFLFKKAPERVIDGMKIAIEFLEEAGSGRLRPLRKFHNKRQESCGAGAPQPANVKGIIYINHKYYKQYAKNLKKIIDEEKALIEVFMKPINSGYIGGEETSALNTIEGKRTEPRLRPPFPPTNGLYGQPTLINNVETFYAVSLIDKGEYQNKRLYTIHGDCMWHGVFEYSEDWTIEKILKQTKNWPKFPFFVQAGGDASGVVLNQNQLRKQAIGSGSIRIYSKEKYNKPMQLIKHWLNFFLEHSCGQCTPCREGVYRLVEIIKSPKPDWKLFGELLNNLEDASFCGLGCVVPVPIKSYLENVIAKTPEKQINLPKGMKKVICECFK